jgi:hypothetical protein
MRSEHSFPPLRAGLVMYLTRNLTPEASGALQLDQSETIHGNGTVINKQKISIKIIKFVCHFIQEYHEIRTASTHLESI